jgi:hypothetical protein
MKIFDRLFTPPPPPAAPSTQQQIDALASATPESLERLALDADEARLRAAAIGQLPDGPTLRQFAGIAAAPEGHSKSAALRLAAQKRLGQLLDTGAVDFERFIADREHAMAMLDVVAHCSDPERLPRALAAFTSPDQLATLAEEGGSTRLRQLAATALEDPEHLKPLLKRLRGKDRNVYRIVQQKCDVFIAEARRLEAAAHEAATLCAALERHATATFDAVYEATIDVHVARWQSLDPRPDAELEQRATVAIARCRAVAEAHRLELEREAAARADVIAQAAAREQAREAELEAERMAAAEREVEAEAHARADADAGVARDIAAQAEAERQEAAEQVHRQIGGLVRLALGVLKAGNSRKAAGFRLAIEEQLQSAPPLPPHLTRGLQQLDDKLNELRHWKDYAVAPKRVELIEEMEALVGSDEEPAALAERIRALQQEWRTIRKGIASESAEEMERFQRAHQAAFKPCQEHFAAQAALRRDNLEARRQVVERLRALAAAQAEDQADRRSILAALREAPREFWRPAPVERDAGRVLHKEFDELIERLRGQLNAWYDGNVAARQVLIDEARALLALEDTARAIDAVRPLQARWKDSGPVVPRERDQALWNEFRECCDAVFKRREQAFAEHAAGLEATKAQALALAAEVEAATEAEPPSRSEASAKMQAWRTAFESLGDVPRADGRGLRDRFERAVVKYEARLADQGRRDAEASVSKLFEAARYVRACERASTEGAESETTEALRAAAEAFIASVARWPKGGLQALRQALSRAGTPPATDITARETALRMLCIRAELLASLPTPAEDDSLRRAYQVERLMRGMGQGLQTDDRDWDAMLLEWLAIPAIATERHEALDTRFQHALARRPAPQKERPAYAERPARADRDGRADRRPQDDRAARGDRRGGPPRDDRRR